MITNNIIIDARLNILLNELTEIVIYNQKTSGHKILTGCKIMGTTKGTTTGTTAATNGCKRPLLHPDTLPYLLIIHTCRLHLVIKIN